jgi:hypothetical protein
MDGNWRPRAFAVWGTILFGTGLIYELVASRLAVSESSGWGGRTGAAQLPPAGADLLSDYPVTVKFDFKGRKAGLPPKQRRNNGEKEMRGEINEDDVQSIVQRLNEPTGFDKVEQPLR